MTTRGCVLIAAGSPFAAQRAARAAGLEPQVVLGKRDCVGRLAEIRARALEEGVETVAIHSADWDRQPLPQIYELAALRLRLPNCRILVDDGRRQIPVSRSQLAGRAARLPLDAATALTYVGLESARMARTRQRRSGIARNGGAAVLGIYPGDSEASVGGPVTHMAGILAGFKHLGFRVGLLTMVPPPPQLEEVADEIEVALPMSRTFRLTREVEAVCSNRTVRAAGLRLIERLNPTVVYQRHLAFATFGVELAEIAGAPLALEWNKSEAWVHRHWHDQNPVKRAFNPLASKMERYVVEQADVVVAVSSHSAQEALSEGARRESVVVLPNAVDIEVIDRARAGAEGHTESPGAVVGWVGTFDPWHGAEVLVRALAQLPDEVDAVFVGDGTGRAECEQLADALGVRDRIRFTGSLPHAQAVRRMAECEILVSPHVPMQERPFFGSPTKIFEYMAIGRPIVASGLEQIGEILDDQRTAVLVTPGDLDDLVRGISSVLALPDRGRQLGVNARAEVASQHTWDARVQVVLDTLGNDGSPRTEGRGPGETRPSKRAVDG